MVEPIDKTKTPPVTYYVAKIGVRDERFYGPTGPVDAYKYVLRDYTEPKPTAPDTLFVWASRPFNLIKNPSTNRLALPEARRFGTNGLAAFFGATDADPALSLVEEPYPKKLPQAYGVPDKIPSNPKTYLEYLINTSGRIKIFDDTERLPEEILHHYSFYQPWLTPDSPTQLVRYEKDQGAWKEVRTDLNVEEAYAFALMNRSTLLNNDIIGIQNVGSDFRYVLPSENPWLEKNEGIDLLHAIQVTVLPRLPEAERKEMTDALETVAHNASTVEGHFVGKFSAEKSAQIRTIFEEQSGLHRKRLEKTYNDLIAIARVIYELPEDHKTIGQIVVPYGYAAETKIFTNEGLTKIVGNVLAHVKSIRYTGPNEATYKDAIEKLEKMQAELKANTKEARHAMLGAKLLKPTPKEEPITLLAINAQSGGLLSDSQETLLDMPIDRSQDIFNLDLRALAAWNDEEKPFFTRDLKAVLSHWKKTGAMDFTYPATPSFSNAGTLKMGNVSIPVKVDTAERENIDTKYFLALLREGVAQIPNTKPFGQQYLSTLASQGIRKVVFVSNAFMEEYIAASAAEVAKKAETWVDKDPKKAAILIKTAAAQMTFVPSGLYSSDEKTIYLNIDTFSQKTLLHEMAHADQFVRIQKQLLTQERVDQINLLQADFMKTDTETVSRHPEAQAATPTGAQERRTDAMVVFWTDPERLKQVDPDLYNYYIVLTSVFQQKKGPAEVDEKPKAIGERFIYPKTPFAPGVGGIALYAAQHPYANTDMYDCYLRLGLNNQWLDLASTSGCTPLEEKKK